MSPPGGAPAPGCRGAPGRVCSDTLPEPSGRPDAVTVPIAVTLVIALGAALVFAATRATATVNQGRAFIRWMLVVFVCFVLLASLPVVIAF